MTNGNKLNIIDTDPCEIPNLSPKSLSKRPSLRRTRVRKNSFKGLRVRGGPFYHREERFALYQHTVNFEDHILAVTETTA